MKINQNTNLDKYLDVAKLYYFKFYRIYSFEVAKCDFKTRYLKKNISSDYNKS